MHTLLQAESCLFLYIQIAKGAYVGPSLPEVTCAWFFIMFFLFASY